MTRPGTETEDPSLSNTKNYETLIKQTYKKPQETLEFITFQTKRNVSFQSTNPI